MGRGKGSKNAGENGGLGADWLIFDSKSHGNDVI